MQRGFKAWCERYAVDKRIDLGIEPHAPLEPYRLAENLGVRVCTPSDIIGLSKQSLEILMSNDGMSTSCWSAVTLVVESKTLIILNSSHSVGRQASDLTHELSHRVLEHKTHEMSVSADGVMLLSSYGKEQEEEADWLSSVLLLPREALVSIKRKGITPEESARAYGVSLSMLKYRMSMSGVNRQFA